MILLSMASFVVFIEEKMKERNWNQADLAREANMTTSMVSNLINGKRKIGIGTANSLAKAFRLPVTEVLQQAGLIPRIPEATVKEQQLLHLFRHMDDKQQQDVLDYSDFILNR